MPDLVIGIVKNGVVVPNAPLPEGACLEIHFHESLEIPPEFQEEFEAWERGERALSKRSSAWGKRWKTKKIIEVWQVYWSFGV